MTERSVKGTFDPDWGLLSLILLLLGIGLVMLTSASMSVAENSTGRPFFYLTQQMIAVIAGLVVATVILKTPTELWMRVAPVMLIVAVLLLVAVLIPSIGHEVNGSKRWISLGGINLQVSEPARLLLLMYISGYVVRHRESFGNSFKDFLRPMGLVMVVCALLLAEPDFGATVVMLLISMAVLFVGGAPIRYFLVLSIAVIAGLIALAVSAPYRLRRLTGFADPWDDPFGSGFQLTQSLIAIGSGEWTGVGLGNSVQKLFYLPEAHTDFVFAVIAEEFGLLGTVVLVLLFSLLVWRALCIAMDAAERDRYYQAYLAFGIAVWQGVQVFINLGVNMGILPTKGLTLPLVSYGRSNLVITIAALALLIRIDMENRGAVSSSKASKGSKGSKGNKGRSK